MAVYTLAIISTYFDIEITLCTHLIFNYTVNVILSKSQNE